MQYDDLGGETQLKKRNLKTVKTNLFRYKKSEKIIYIQTYTLYYRSGNLIDLPPFHGCGLNNRNGSRKLVRYEIGEQCVFPTWKRYWKKTRPKYRDKIGFCFWKRHKTQTRHRHLFKSKGNFVYNYKLKKYMHMKFTPMPYEFKDMQKFKQNLWKNELA